MPLFADKFFSGQPTRQQEVEFWRSLHLHGAVFKTTDERRMDDLNALVNDCWIASGFRPERVLDVGVSSGITSLEWLEAMQAAGFDPAMVATDVAIRAKIVRIAPFHKVLVRDTPTREPLQHSLFGWTLPAHFAIGFRSLVSSVTAIPFYGLVRALGFLGVTETSISLVSPKCLAGGKLSIEEDDVFDSSSKAQLGSFDVVRVANLLNTAFFSANRLQLALQNIRAMLNGAGAYLIVNRTLGDGSNHGSMFRVGAQGRFQPVMQIGNGSEIADLVLSLPALP